jgi:hypothetical protein
MQGLVAIPLSLTGTRLAWTQHIQANHFSLFPTSAMESPNLWLLHLPRLPTRPFGLSAPSTGSGGFRQFVDTAFLFGVQRVSRKMLFQQQRHCRKPFWTPNANVGPYCKMYFYTKSQYIRSDRRRPNQLWSMTFPH